MMIIENSLLLAIGAGAFTTLLVSWALVKSTHIHGKHTLDYEVGVQKFHSSPTPRIGGVALIVGFIASWIFLEGETRTLWGLIGLAGVPALAFGLAEDITKKVRVKWRLLATIFSGLIFALASGYTISSIEVPGFDILLDYSLVALAFTAFAVGGVANSINLIDGFHGLASGTMMIMLLAFALVSNRVDDTALMGVALTMLAVMVGFFIVNFPTGSLFLGDAGAYFAGFVIAVLAVMLPARNPEVSPWVSMLILGYPVTETLVSILRRLRKSGHSPGDPDSDHLHHVVHRSWALGFAKNIRLPKAKNALTSVLVWSLPIITLIAVEFSNLGTKQSVPLLLLIVVVYLGFYRATHLAGLRIKNARKV